MRHAAAWVAKTDVSTVDTGLSPVEALLEAPEFLRLLREGTLTSANAHLEGTGIDILHAACRLLAEPAAGGLENPAADARDLYNFIEKVTWPGPDFEERAELLAGCAFAGWRNSRRKALPPETEEWQARFVAAASASPLRQHLEHARTCVSGEPRTVQQVSLNDSETLLPLLENLRTRVETSPSDVREEAAFLYEYLEALEPRCPADAFLLDEREYFLGETARIAGATSRILALREEARRWLDLAEGWFLLTENAQGNLSKMMYQRLAVRMEECDFAGVSALLPQLIASFEKLGMKEDVLKARFLHAAVLREIGNVPEAIKVYLRIVDEAKELKNEPLLAHAYANLVQLYGLEGMAPQALEMAKEAMPLLHRLGNHVAAAKLQWGLAYVHRSHGDALASIDAFRAAQHDFAVLGMRSDLAAVHLVIADFLLDAGQEKQAEWEIRQALPIIDEYKLVPEGFAALTLLRESLRRQAIDRQALRNLHSHLEKPSS